MADLYAECDWDGGTLNLFLPELPDEILVHRLDYWHRPLYSAHVHRYVPERTARRVAVFSEGTDFTVGHTECGACGGSINPCAAFCEHCGAKFEGDES